LPLSRVVAEFYVFGVFGRCGWEYPILGLLYLSFGLAFDYLVRRSPILLYLLILLSAALCLLVFCGAVFAKSFLVSIPAFLIFLGWVFAFRKMRILSRSLPFTTRENQEGGAEASAVT